MGIPYHLRIKATVDGMTTHILSRQGQTNAVKAQDYGNSVLEPARCVCVFCWWILYHKKVTTINSGAYYGSSEEHCKKHAVKRYEEHAVKWCFAPPR
ncbi:hypothetical protein TNCV_5043821 [Trichonephila clavipes]|uniref:Uncharacterized protein n=1 Tax=Trichonephila clavipes TaxID=2585209 RepID=A0A8X6WJL2_TRICX|nr:hypothetical protein TNCV_5043821 [Trichonephila clavipes]